MPETDCPKMIKAADLRVESLGFSQIPGQSRLFLQYLSDPISLRGYYPSAVASHTRVSERIPQVLGQYATNRAVLCDALADLNHRFGAAPAAFENIDRLRENETVAVVTGQQAGLFSGPLYTIYKALSAVRMAECLRRRGFNAVPVFWIATEDHDFDEVASANVIDRNGEIAHIHYDDPSDQGRLPVGRIILDDSINKAASELFAALSQTEFTAVLDSLLRDAYVDGCSMGIAFAKVLSRLFSRFGLIVVDPMDARLKLLAAPIYGEAIRKSAEIVSAIRARSSELEAAGFHSQVLVEDDYFPFFWHDDRGVRRALKRLSSGAIKVNGDKAVFNQNELVEIAEKEPERLSPGVMLRPIVQDYLFPTVCYFGGAAEIAYFAQNSEAYRLLGRPATTILHRQSFTLIEARHQRTLSKFGLGFADLFEGFDQVAARVVQKFIDPEHARLFPDAEERINIELNRLDQNLSNLDPTLAANLATRRRKIIYHIGALRDKFNRSRIRKDAEAYRQLRGAFSSLLPDGQLQERSLNVSTFLNRYGDYFVTWLYDAVDLDDNGHRLVYL